MAKKSGGGKDPRLARAGVSGYNKPKKTPSHPTKSHVVVAKVGDQVKQSALDSKALRVRVRTPPQPKTKHVRSLIMPDIMLKTPAHPSYRQDTGHIR